VYWKLSRVRRVEFELSSAEFELRLCGNKTSTLAEIPVTYNCPFCHRSLGSFELMSSLSLSLSLVTHIHTHTLSLYLLTLSCTHFLSLDLLALFCTRSYLSFLSLSLCRCVSLSLVVSLSLSRHRSTHTPTHILSPSLWIHRSTRYTIYITMFGTQPV
jgi:hypothetical protein